MTAETTGRVMWSPNLLRQRMAAHTVEDVLNLPDVLVFERPVEGSNRFVPADQVVIAVEVVSRGTQTRDRLFRPAELAAAGIPHYWRIEQNPVHVYAYDLGNGEAELVADSTEELVLSKPFEIRLPIRDIAP